jgi:hypothetical protein
MTVDVTARVPLGPAVSQSSTSMAITAPTGVPVKGAHSTSQASLALSFPAALGFLRSAGVSAASAAITLPGEILEPPPPPLTGFLDGSQENLFISPRFANGVLGCPSQITLAGGVTDASAVLKGPPVLEGEYSLRMYVSANSGATVFFPLITYEWDYPAIPGETFCVSASTGYAGAGLGGALGLVFRDASKVVLASYEARAPIPIPPPLRVWPLAIGGLVAPPGTTHVGLTLGLAIGASAHTTGSVLFDEVLLSPRAEVPGFFDGDSGGGVWLGPQRASASRRQGEAPTLAFAKGLSPPLWWEAG